MFPTSTPEPTKDVSCPDGVQPLGWGTVTPSEYWVNQCLRCVTPIGTVSPLFVTSTPMPNGSVTPTPNGSVTPTPNGSVTPTPNGSVTPTIVPNVCPLFPSSILGYSASTWISNDSSLTNFGNYHEFVFDGRTYRKLGAVGMRVSATGNFYARCVNAEWTSNDPYWSTHGGGKYGCTDVIAWGGMNLVGTNQGGCARVSGTNDFYCSSGSAGYFEVNFVESGYFSPSWSDFYVKFALSPTLDCGLTATPTSIATVTATPTASTYCSVVQSDIGLYEENNFELPIFRLGDKTCPVNIDGIAIPLYGMFGWSDLVTSPIRICLQEITFGNLIYYGMDIDLDYLAYVLAAGAILRMILRS